MNFTEGHYVKLSTVRLFSEPSDLELLRDSLDSDSIEMLWRKQYEDLRQTLDFIRNDNSVRQNFDDKVFDGPAGAGKSCLLYSMAQYGS